MITNEFLRMMSRYNRWQNGWQFAVADGLSDEERTLDRTGFWGSIQTTLCHIYWADKIWLSRFDLVEPPTVGIKESGRFIGDWSELKVKRQEMDDLTVDWSDHYQKGAVAGTLKWFSGAMNKDVQAPLSVVLPHIFNHQTHHRGQVHAMLTAAGIATENTDLFLMPKELWPNS